MQETSDLLPPKVANWLIKELRAFRQSGGHGFLRLNIQDGRILTFGRYDGYKNDEKPQKQTKA